MEKSGKEFEKRNGQSTVEEATDSNTPKLPSLSELKEEIKKAIIEEEKKVLEESEKAEQEDEEKMSSSGKLDALRQGLTKLTSKNDVFARILARTKTQDAREKTEFPYPIIPSSKIKNVMSELRTELAEEEEESGSKLIIPRVINKMANPNNTRFPFKRKVDEIGFEFWFLIDLSGSMGGYPLMTEKQILATLYDSIVPYMPEIKFKMFGFEGEDYNPHVYEFDRKRLLTIGSGGGTPTGGALTYLYSQMKKSPNEKALILITDGAPNNKESATKGVNLIKTLNVPVFTLFAGNPDEHERRTFSSSDALYEIHDMSQAKPILEKIIVGDIVKRIKV